MSNVRIFKYKRGETWSVVIIVNPFSGLVYDKLSYPPNTPDKLKGMFLDEAEAAVLKIIEPKVYNGII